MRAVAVRRRSSLTLCPEGNLLWGQAAQACSQSPRLEEGASGTCPGPECPPPSGFVRWLQPETPGGGWGEGGEVGSADAQCLRAPRQGPVGPLLNLRTVAAASQETGGSFSLGFLQSRTQLPVPPGMPGRGGRPPRTPGLRPACPLALPFPPPAAPRLLP